MCVGWIDWLITASGKGGNGKTKSLAIQLLKREGFTPFDGRT